MEEVLQWIQKLLTDYGVANVIIMALAIILTNIIKKPIVKKAEEFVESAKKLTGVNVDKSMITSFLCIIPIVLCFIFYFFYGLIQINWQIAQLDWTQVFSNAVIYGMLSISIFETIKGFINAYVSKKNYNEAKKQLQESEIVDETTDLVEDSQEIVLDEQTEKPQEEIQEQSSEDIKMEEQKND